MHPSGTYCLSHLFKAALAELAFVVSRRLYLEKAYGDVSACSKTLLAPHNALPRRGKCVHCYQSSGSARRAFEYEHMGHLLLIGYQTSIALPLRQAASLCQISGRLTNAYHRLLPLILPVPLEYRQLELVGEWIPPLFDHDTHQ